MKKSNVQIKEANILLLRALAEQNLPMLEQAIKDGADLDVRDSQDTHPFTRAFQISYGLDKNRSFGTTDFQKNLLPNTTDFVYPLLMAANSRGTNHPLQWACRHGLLNIVKALLATGASIDAQDNNGDTALHWAARNRNLDIINVLIENNANVNIHNDYSDTPLHEVAGMLLTDTADINNAISCAISLLQAGAEIDATGFKDLTPLACAINQWRYTDVIKDEQYLMAAILADEHYMMAAMLAEAGAKIPMNPSYTVWFGYHHSEIRRKHTDFFYNELPKISEDSWSARFFHDGVEAYEKQKFTNINDAKAYVELQQSTCDNPIKKKCYTEFIAGFKDALEFSLICKANHNGLLNNINFDLNTIVEAEVLKEKSTQPIASQFNLKKRKASEVEKLENHEIITNGRDVNGHLLRKLKKKK